MLENVDITEESRQKCLSNTLFDIFIYVSFQCLFFSVGLYIEVGTHTSEVFS